MRTIDWRVTARTGKPHVRVYTEEKDRPALLVVDQRINMFFGTRRVMKSVAAGGFVFNDHHIGEVRPHRSRAAVMRLLETLAGQNRELRADSTGSRSPEQLDAALDAAAQVATHDHLVVIASDFDGDSARTRDLLLRLALHNDVVVVLIYDPFLLELPPAGDLAVSDGELQVELEVAGAKTRQGIAAFVGERSRSILAWQSELGIPVLPLSAAEETAPQLRRLPGRRQDSGGDRRQ